MDMAALAMLSVIAVLFILLPYFKAHRVEQTDAPDIEVYKAQLKELDGDIERGLINEDEAKRARIEIERRLLKAADRKATELAVEKPNHLLAGVLVLVLLTSSGLYLMIGTPGMPDFPKSLDGSDQENVELAAERERINGMIVKIKDRLAVAPEEVEGWAYLGNLELGLGNFQSAAEALNNARMLEPEKFEYQFIYAASLIMASMERVPPAAKIILNKAAKLNPDHPGPKYYLALADFQAGDVETAYADWLEIRASLEEGSSLIPSVDVWINRAQAELGLTQQAAQTRAPSISREQAETIGNMSDDDQQELIRQMVGQLAQKQADNPGNIQGWLQLARSYMVLDQRDDAIAAMKSAVANAPEDQKADLQKEVDKLTNLQ